MDMNTRIHALRKIWIFCAALCGLAFVASLGIQSFSLDTPLVKRTIDEKEQDSV
jgi:hypothetical protein